MRYTGTGVVEVEIDLMIGVDSYGEDIDDAYGPASEDLEYIAMELENAVREWVRNYNRSAEGNGSTVDSIEYRTVGQTVEHLDNSLQADHDYDGWRDQQMLRED